MIIVTATAIFQAILVLSFSTKMKYLWKDALQP